MGTLSGAQIRRLVAGGQLVIDPFEEQMIQPASYDLRIGSKLLASPLSREILGAIIELNDKVRTYNVQSGQMVSVLSKEKLQLPLDICGGFGIRSSYARRGIDAFGGVQLDPGFRGRLTMNLLNVGPEPVPLTIGEPLFTVQFQRLDEPAEVGYQGAYQDQDDFPQDQYEYILTARTTSLAEIPTLRQEVVRLNVLIEELQELLPDPDAGWDLRPEVVDKLRKSLENPDANLIPLDDMREKIRRRA